MFKSLYLNTRLFIAFGVVVAVFLFAYFFPSLFSLAQISLFALMGLVVLDIWMLYRLKEGVWAQRNTPEKFSNGDPNPIQLALENRYPHEVRLSVVDEAPVQFQLRDMNFQTPLAAGEQKTLQYELRPVERGEYHFGALNVFVSAPLGLLRRRYRFDQAQMVPTYPSYIQMRKYQLMAISNRLTEVGVKKIRRLGHTTEFEQIKEYVRGDDYRTVNWKATARTGKLMVNQYNDERAQNVFSLIDMSRVMKMPFEGMTLLDYAINATLVISNIAIYKHDKAGLISFAERISSSVPASNKAIQMSLIQEVLYNQQTQFLEADYGRLYAYIRRKISHRSLLILYTNFESLTAMRRQLPYLVKISKQHLLVVIFFENTALRDLLRSRPESTEEIYIKTIGENFDFEKKQIVLELEQHGIAAILTPPEQLTVNTVNKYLELKSRGMI